MQPLSRHSHDGSPGTSRFLDILPEINPVPFRVPAFPSGRYPGTIKLLELLQFLLELSFVDLPTLVLMRATSLGFRHQEIVKRFVARLKGG